MWFAYIAPFKMNFTSLCKWIIQLVVSCGKKVNISELKENQYFITMFVIFSKQLALYMINFK